MRTGIFVIEDHPLMRQMLSEFLKTTDDLELCGTAASGEEALEQLDEAGADLVLVDMSLPKMNGAELVALIRERWPHLRCVVLSGHKESTYLERALAAGADGYIVKGDPHELPGAIRQVLAGETYLSRSVRGPQ